MVSGRVGCIVAEAKVCNRDSDGTVSFGILHVVPCQLSILKIDLRQVRATYTDELGSDEGMYSERNVSLGRREGMAQAG